MYYEIPNVDFSFLEKKITVSGLCSVLREIIHIGIGIHQRNWKLHTRVCVRQVKGQKRRGRKRRGRYAAHTAVWMEGEEARREGVGGV